MVKGTWETIIILEVKLERTTFMQNNKKRKAPYGYVMYTNDYSAVYFWKVNVSTSPIVIQALQQVIPGTKYAVYNEPLEIKGMTIPDWKQCNRVIPEPTTRDKVIDAIKAVIEDNNDETVHNLLQVLCNVLDNDRELLK